VFGKGKLMREGAEAQALVLDKRIYAQTVQSNTVTACNYKLRVRFDDGSTTEISRRAMSRELAWVPVGGLLPVRYDPDDRSKVELDEPALKALRTARAEEAREQAVARGEEALTGRPQRSPVQAEASAFADEAAEFRKEAAEFKERSAAFRDQSAGLAGSDALEALKRKVAGQGSPDSSDSLDRLQKLADLHDSGALTDAEFAAEKAKLLGER
jgi:hypothetical protein